MSAAGQSLTVSDKELDLERVHRYLKISLITRALVTAGILGALFLPNMRHLIDIEIFWLLFAVEIVANAGYIIFGFKKWPTSAFHFSGLVDIFALGVLANLTGGMESGFIALLALIIVFNGLFYGYAGLLSGALPSIAVLPLANFGHPFDPNAFVLLVGVWTALAFLSSRVGESEKEHRIELKNRANQITAALATSTAIENQLEAEALLTMAADRTREIVQDIWAPDATVVLVRLDHESRECRVVRVAGTHSHTDPFTYPFDELPQPVMDSLLSTEAHFLDEEASQDALGAVGAKDLSGAIFIAPMMSGTDPLGCIALHSRDEPPPPDRLVIVETIANHLASALTRLNTFANEKRHREQAMALFGLARELNSITDLDEVLHRISEAAVELGSVDGAVIGLITPAGDAVIPRAWAGAGEARVPTPEEVEEVIGEFPIEEIAEMLQERRPMIIKDISEESALKQRVAELFNARSGVVFPIFSRGESVGAMAWTYAEVAKPLSIAQWQLGEAISGLAAVAIDNVSLLASKSEQARENAALFEAARLVASVLNVSDTLDRIAEAALSAVKAKRAGVFLIESNQLVPKVMKNAEGTHEARFGLLEGVDLTDELRSFFETGDVVSVDEEDHLPMPGVWCDTIGSCRFQLAPLSIREKAVGILALEIPDEVHMESQRKVVVSVASMAAAAIDNAFMFEAEKEAVKQLTELDRMKSDFVSTASHELRTPLTSITGYTRTLIRKGADLSDKERHEFLEVIDNQANQLARLIDELLTISRIEHGELHLAFHAIDVEAIVESLFESMKLRAQGHTFELRLPDGFPPLVADEGKFLQIMSNLIDNAIKYSPDGGEIEVGGRQLGDSVQLSVSDHGVGMTPEQTAEIFEKFYQAADRPPSEGAGLGLYIVKQLVEAHGGEISVESTPGEGTTFYVTFPQRRAVDAAVSRSGAADAD